MKPFPWQAEAWSQLARRRAALPHALLLHGPAGIGKQHLATVFARALLCRQPAPDGLACGVCPACHWLELGNHPDFRIVQPEAAETPDADAPGTSSAKASRQIRIEQIRGLQEWLAVGAHQGGSRLAIVVPAEAMNPASANALLKTLEEPPPGTVLILVSHDAARLLPTIRSRCQSIVLGKPDVQSALEWLAESGMPDAGALLALAGGAPLAARDHGERLALARAVAAELSAARIDPVAAAGRLQAPLTSDVIDLLQKWVVDLVRTLRSLPVRYYRGHESELVRAAEGVDQRAVLGFHRRLIEAARLAEHPLNLRAVLEDLLIDYARLRPSPATRQDRGTGSRTMSPRP